MAERSVLTLSQKTSKTQESMRAKLEEWRKAKQQQTAQLKPQRTHVKTPRVNPKLSHQKTINNLPSSKTHLPLRPSLRNRKRKSLSAPPYKTAGVHEEKTFGHDIVSRGRLSPYTNYGHDENNENNGLQENAKENKRCHSEPVFDSKPPENFEIESGSDPKKTRRSTFTIDPIVNEIVGKNTDNPKPCGNGQQNLRKKLDVWRENKRKLEAKQSIPKRINPQIKPQSNYKDKDKPKSGNNSVRPRDSIKYKHTCCVKKHLGNEKVLPKKNETRIPCGQPKKVVQVVKDGMDSKNNKTTLSKTPVKLQLPYMDKHLSMRERLELWRKEKGKTSGFTKTPATLKRKGTMTAENNHQPIAMETLESLQLEPFETMNCDLADKEHTPEEIKQKLQDCLEKVKQVENTDDIIASQLDEIQKSHPSALQCAEFWICRAKIAEHEEDHGRVVCLYEQALVFIAEPEHLIKEAVAVYSQRRQGRSEGENWPTGEETFLAHQTNPVTPSRECHRIEQTGKPSPIDSSIIKYSVTKATPFKSRLKSCERPVVTPVRRSIRLERRSVNYPSMLQEHGLAVRHLDDLPEDIKSNVMFKPNFTVQNELNEAWRDLWSDDM